MSKQLSQGSLEKAQKIVKQKMIVKVDDTTWQVQSSDKKNVYAVELTANGLYCSPCMAWKNNYPHDCKHCEAVRIFERQNGRDVK